MPEDIRNYTLITQNQAAFVEFRHAVKVLARFHEMDASLTLAAFGELQEDIRAARALLQKFRWDNERTEAEKAHDTIVRQLQEALAAATSNYG